MNKRFLILAYFFFTLNFIACSQKESSFTNGVITYKYYLEKELLNSSIEKIKKEKPEQWAVVGKDMMNSQTTMDEFQIKLYFTEKESYCNLVEDVNKEDDMSYQMAKLFAKVDKIHYLNKSKKQRLYERTSPDKASVIHITEPYQKYDWTLTGKTKKVGEYIYREAIGTYKVYSQKGGTNEKQVFAWFIPKLPFSFGPMGFDGLPGLIVELSFREDYFIGYRATNIDIQRGTQKNKLPKLQKPIEVMTLEEREKMAAQQLQSLGINRKN